jgi:hypothetical protein
MRAPDLLYSRWSRRSLFIGRIEIHRILALGANGESQFERRAAVVLRNSD